MFTIAIHGIVISTNLYSELSVHLKVDAKLTTVKEITRNLIVNEAKSDSQQMTEGKNHDIEVSHSKRWSETPIREIGNYFWDNPIWIHVHSVKKIPGIDHSKSPLKDIVKNIFDAKLAPLFTILTSSSSAICHLACWQCSMFSVYLKCVSRFFQWIRISNKEFVSNFALQMKFRMRNRWKC